MHIEKDEIAPCLRSQSKHHEPVIVVENDITPQKNDTVEPVIIYDFDTEGDVRLPPAGQ